MSSPDLFVVCKSCGSEVSPYVTECPYCGTRLRKRAPKIEREGGVPKPPKPGRRERRGRRRERDPGPRLTRLRTGEIPGIRGDDDRRPWATIVLVALSFGVFLSLAFLVSSDLYVAAVGGDPWRYLTAVFLNVNSWAQFAVIAGVAVFGWLLERRNGPVVVVVVFALAGIGAIAGADALDPGRAYFGTHGAALGLLAAWAVPVLLARRRGDDDEADLLGVGVFALVLLLVPVATGTSVLVSVLGALLGGLAGLALSALRPRSH
jgi:membrane associated rhomboid family serine protease/DNA-directed RNA polymerase subunit RPC12/RpoP